MRIFHYTAFTRGFVNSWQTPHIVDELTHAGHDVRFFNAAQEIGRAGTAAEYSQALIDAFRAEHAKNGYDLFFAVAQDALLTADAVQDIRRMGVPTLHLSCDDLSHPFRVTKLASAFDIHWSTVRESKARIESYGGKVVVLPWGTNPHVFRPEKVQEDSVISFMGTPYGARARHLANLAAAGLPVRIYGQAPSQMYGDIAAVNHPLARIFATFGESWKRTVKGLSFPEGRQIIYAALVRSVQETVGNPPEKTLGPEAYELRESPTFENMGQAFSATALSLGSLELASTHVLKNPLLFIRLREFEAPMCGAVHVANRLPELAEYFEEDREMIYFASQEELADKVRFWLSPKRDTARAQIRLAARQRGEGEHTWLHRFRTLGHELGLSF